MDLWAAVLKLLEFLSTPSGWRATSQSQLASKSGVFLSTPSGWRATNFFDHILPHISISIHALRVEGDEKYVEDNKIGIPFLSTPSGWRATPD